MLKVKKALRIEYKSNLWQELHQHTAPYLDYRSVPTQNTVWEGAPKTTDRDRISEDSQSRSNRTPAYSGPAIGHQAAGESHEMADTMNESTKDIEPVDILASRIDDMYIDLNTQADTLTSNNNSTTVVPITIHANTQSGPQKVYTLPYTVEGAREPPSLEGIVDTKDSIDTTVHRKYEKRKQPEAQHL